MNSYYSPSQEYEIDIHDFFWKLLMQWKAVLIVCLVMAFLVPGAKFLKDSRDYESTLAEQAEAEEEASLPMEERINAILDMLPAEDVSAVRFVVQQQDLIALQQDYFNNSILLNIDPTSQRNLNIKYYLQRGEVSDMQALVDAYSTCVRRTKVIQSFREVISPESSLQFIYELISSYGGSIADSEVGSTLFTINIVLPDNVDADAVVKTADKAISNIYNELASAMGNHSIARVNTEDYRFYSTTTADRRSSVSLAVNNLYNSINAAKGRFTDKQLEALEAITEIKNVDLIEKSSSKGGEGVSAEDEIKEPTFNKKYSLIGFVFGAFLYAIVYLLFVILRKTVSSASVAQNYTGTRLLGELYALGNHKGIGRILSSSSVAKRRYKRKLNINAQSEIIASTIDAVCSHHNADSITLLTSGIPEDLEDVIDIMIKTCRKDDCNIQLDVLNTKEIDEKKLSGIRNVIYAVSNETKIDSVGKLVELCGDYDISPLGTLYMEML